MSSTKGKSMQFIKKNWKSALLVLSTIILTPIFLGFILKIPTGHLTIGDEGSWVGFFGNYSGGIIGGIVAYIISKNQMNISRQEKAADLMEKEKFANTIVENFLYDEIKVNLKRISPEVMESLMEHADGNLRIDYIIGNRKYIYDIYNEIKFELVKYSNPIVRQTIDVYRLLKRFELETQISNFSNSDAREFYEHFNRWKIRLSI